MENTTEYTVEKNNILYSIDKSLKKIRDTKNYKYPYAIVISTQNSENFKLENLTYLKRNGFQSIPIVKHPNIKANLIKFAFNEESLIKLITSSH